MSHRFGFAESLGVAVIIATLLLVADLLFLRLGVVGVLLAEVLVIGVPVALYSWAAGFPPRATFRLTWPPLPHLALALALAPAVALIASALLRLELGVWPLAPAEHDAWLRVEAEAGRAPWIGLLGFVVAPAVMEEALFRGLLLSRLERKVGAARAVVLSAALFAVFHRSVHRLAAQGLLGCLLGLLVVRSSSILPAVLLHFGYNLAIFTAGAPLSELSADPRALLAAALGVGGALAWLLRPVRAPGALASLAAVVLVGLLAGCSGRQAPPAPDATITIALEAAPRDLDPRQGVDAASQHLHQLLHASLLQIGPTGALVNDLARSVEWTDERTWRVKVRRDAVFHDGRPLTARDVAATFAGLVSGDVPSPRRGPYTRIERVEAIDAETVVFTTCEPFPSLPVNLVLGIVPEGSPADFGNHPIGAGPFRLAGGDGLTTFVLERHERWHGGQAASPRLLFRVVPDATTRCLELRKGSVDLVLNGSLPFDALEPLRALPTLAVDTAQGTAYSYVGFNLRDPVLAHHEVREAIARAIDRDLLGRYLQRGYASKASAPLAPGNPYFVEDLPVFEHDVARARELLDAAGYPDPDGDGPRARLKLVMRTSTDESARLQALAIADMVREAGIDLEVRSYEFSTFFEDVRAGRFQLFTLRRVGLTDPDWFRSVFHSRSTPPAGENRGAYVNLEVDRLIEEAEREMDPQRRQELYVQVQRRVAEDLPYVSLFHLANVAVRSTRIAGLQLYAGGEFTPLFRLYRKGQ